MKKRRIMSWVAAALLAASVVFPAATAFAAEDVSSLAVTTRSEMTITTAEGAVIDPDASGNYTDVPKDAKLFVEYAFSLPDNNGLEPDDPSYTEYSYFTGDYLDVQLPYAVAFEEPTGGWNVLDAGSNVMGTLTIESDGLARIVFTDYVETHSSITGWFNLEGTFKDGIFDEGDPVEITVEFDGTTADITFLEDGDALSISADKSGVYDPATNRITWAIVVTPNKEVGGLKIEDTFSNNQTYVAGSFTMGAASIDDADLTITPGASTTVITYEGATLSEATTFTYQTEPTATAFAAETGSAENVTFTNGVDVYKNDDSYADDDATVSINWIQKSGAVVGTSYEDSRLIRWTVTVDAGGYSLSGGVVTDTIPADLELYVDATHPIQFAGTDLTNDSSGDPDTYTYMAGAEDTHILTAYLGDLTASGTLVFYTHVTNDDYYTGNAVTTFTNGAEFNWTENVSGTPSDTYGVGVGLGVLSKVAGSTVNYNDNTTNEITWTVTVNANKIDITNAVFTDTIPSGQEYVADSFTINDPEGSGTGPYNGTFVYDSGTKTLTYTFGTTRTISDTYTITFKTAITDYTPLYVNQNNVAFTNSATLTGEGILDNSVTATGRQRYNSQVVRKTVLTGYDHTTRLVTWQIVVDRNEVPLYGAVLTDSIPLGMTFLPDTFSVSGVTGAADDALAYTIYGDDDLTSHDSFTYTFPATQSEQCTITYQTLVKEDYLLTQGTRSFPNTATLTATDLSASSTATASMTNTMVYKSMEHISGADYATWKIVINGEGISMTDISVSDVLQEGLEIDLDSVALYPMTLAANGTLTKVDTPVSESLYTIAYDSSTRELTFGMPGTIDSPYQLEFITDITTSPITIDNTVTLNGTSYTATSVVDDVVITVSETGLGGSGVQGSITIEKVGENEEPLSGAVFTLYNNRGEMVAQDTTDEFGSVTFGGLPIRTYVLAETTAPEGHVLSDETVTFRMDTEVPDVFYQYADEKIRADVVIYKTGVDDVPLSGAEFSLYDSEDNLVDVQTTGADGTATFEDLVYGSYTLVETKAPNGYVRAEDTTPIAVTSVDEIDLTIPNARYVIPQTGGWIDTWSLLAFGGALILAGATWLMIRRRVHAR